MSVNQWSWTARKLGASYVGIGSGERWIDDSGNGHLGVLNDGAEVMSTRLHLDGLDDFVLVAGHADFDVTSNWSMEWTVFPRTDGGVHHFLVYAPVAATNGFTVFGVFSPQVSARFDFQLSLGGVSYSARMTANILQLDAWNHCVITINGGTGVGGTKAAYINGASVALTNEATNAPSQQADLTIGKKVVPVSNFSNAKVGGLAIYPDLTLSATQVAARNKAWLTHPTAGGGGGGG